MALVGCTFDSSGLGLGDGATTGDAENGSTASETTSSSAPSTGDETTTLSDASTSDGASSTGTTEQPAGVAVLELVDPLPHGDFGLVTIHESKARAFVIANVGTGPASNLMWSGVSDPFVFVGGTYPGVGGDCEATLAEGESCMLVLAFEPTTLGPLQTTLGIHFHDGTEAREIERPLIGAGGGATENLLTNGDAEACSGQGAHPAEWVKVGGGWRCEAAPHSGTFSIYGGESGNGLFALRQDVDVSTLAETIDEFGLGFALTGWARSYAGGDDPYHIDILYLGENAEELAGWTTGVQSSNTAWTLHEHARLAPFGTRVISVRLFCSKDGGTYCDAYFDDLDLRAIYPPP